MGGTRKEGRHLDIACPGKDGVINQSLSLILGWRFLSSLRPLSDLSPTTVPSISESFVIPSFCRQTRVPTFMV